MAPPDDGDWDAREDEELRWDERTAFNNVASSEAETARSPIDDSNETESKGSDLASEASASLPEAPLLHTSDYVNDDVEFDRIRKATGFGHARKNSDEDEDLQRILAESAKEVHPNSASTPGRQSQFAKCKCFPRNEDPPIVFIVLYFHDGEPVKSLGSPRVLGCYDDLSEANDAAKEYWTKWPSRQTNAPWRDEYWANWPEDLPRFTDVRERMGGDGRFKASRTHVATRQWVWVVKVKDGERSFHSEDGLGRREAFAEHVFVVDEKEADVAGTDGGAR